MLSICYRGIRGLGCVIPMESVATVTGVFVVSLCDTYGISGYKH